MEHSELVERLLSKHNPSLAKEAGMVYVLFLDGEIVLTKCGELLWQRGLHLMMGAVAPRMIVENDRFPKYSEHSYIFCTKEDAEMLRSKLLEHWNKICKIC